jgi:hypothetical protein
MSVLSVMSLPGMKALSVGEMVSFQKRPEAVYKAFRNHLVNHITQTDRTVVL